MKHNILFIPLISIILVLNNSCSQNNTVELQINHSEEYIITQTPKIGFSANLIKNKMLAISDTITDVKNKYEMHFTGDSISIMVIQTQNDRFYIDKDLDNYISPQDSFSFKVGKPFYNSFIYLDKFFPYISLLKLMTIPDKDVILLKTTEVYSGELNIDNKIKNLCFYLYTNHLRYKKSKAGIRIAVDVNNNKILEANETTKFNTPIMIQNKPIVFTDFKYENGKVLLKYEETTKEESMAVGFIHPDFVMLSIRDSTEISLSKYKGSILVINWWSPSCKPCIAEMPELNQLRTEYKSNLKIEFIAITGYQKK